MMGAALTYDGVCIEVKSIDFIRLVAAFVTCSPESFVFERFSG